MPPEEKENRKPIKSLRTYQGDVEEAMAKNKTSATTILVAEQKKRDASPEPIQRVSDSTTRNKFFTVLGLTLFIFGLAVVGGVYYMRSTEKVAVELKNKTLINFTKEDGLVIASSTRGQLLSSIVEEKNSFKLPANSILYISLKNSSGSLVDVSTVLSMLAPNMPPSLSRAFENKYMIGVYSFDTNEPFIILTTNDYATSYAGMLKWEEQMSSDIGKIFGVVQDASSTPTFLDEALKNKDLRILKDNNDKTTLMYSFIDKNTLVITKNEDIFTAVMGKYLISKQIK